MDNFKEFFELLRSITAKTESPVYPDETNFNSFMANRYLSFVHPGICILLAQTANTQGFMPEEEKAQYEMLKALLPRFRCGRIDYVSKPSSTTQSDKEISDEQLEELSAYMELGKREVRELMHRVALLKEQR